MAGLLGPRRHECTGAGTVYRGLSDADMLRCQTALAPGLQKKDRIQVLEDAMREQGGQP